MTKSKFHRFGRFLTIAVLAGMAAACSQIDTGNVGVVTTLGKIDQEELGPGVYQTLTRTITEVTTKEVTTSLDDMHPKTQDNVTMADFDIDVRWTVAPNKPAELMTRLKGDVAKTPEGDFIVGWNFVMRHAREAVYEAAAKFPSSQIHLKRDDIVADVVKNLQQTLDKDVGPGVFTITGATVRSLITDAKLEEAIRDAAKVEFEVRRKKQEIELANADAEVKRAKARGEADANRIVSESLTPLLMRKLELETQGRFAGNGTHTVVLGGGAPLINVK